MCVVSVTIMWAVRVVVSFKYYSMDGLYLFIYAKDERAGAQTFYYTCTWDSKQ